MYVYINKLRFRGKFAIDVNLHLFRKIIDETKIKLRIQLLRIYVCSIVKN